MSTNNVSYVDSLTAEIEKNCGAGYPYGYDADREEYGESAELSAYDWLEGVLDIEYRVGSDGEYRSALVMIGYGGPNVYVDTKTCELLSYWWGSFESRRLPDEFCAGLDEALAEIMSC